MNRVMGGNVLFFGGGGGGGGDLGAARIGAGWRVVSYLRDGCACVGGAKGAAGRQVETRGDTWGRS